MPDILKDFAVKALNLTDEQFAEIVYSDAEHTQIKDTAEAELLRLDAERVKNLKAASKDDLTAMHDKGYKKGQVETLGKFETSLKEEFGVAESKAQGADLVREIITKISATTQLDENKVKLHPLYVQLEKKLGSDYVAKADHDRIVEEYTGYKTGVEKEKVLYVVKNDALRIFNELKPVLSKDPVKAMNQQTNFLRELEAFGYDIQADGSHIIKKADGTRLETPQGHPTAFKDFIKEQADRYFDFEVQDNKGNAGNQEQNGKPLNVIVPKDKEAYSLAIVNAKTPEERIAIKNAFELANKK